MKNRPFRARLGFALSGIHACWHGEKSFRTQVSMATATLAALILLRPAPVWWAIILVTIMMVMALEALNAALERLIDHLHPGMHPQIGIAKDMAAGAVLLTAIGALCVAICMMIAML